MAPIHVDKRPSPPRYPAVTRTGQRNRLFSFQLLLLMLQLLCPVLYYHATTGIDPNAIFENVGGVNVPLPSQKNSLRSSMNASMVDSSQPSTLRRAENVANADVVGTFNGLKLTYVDQSAPGGSPLHSTAHCIGETFHDKSWMYRSCEYRNLCFDLDEKDFFLFRSPVEAALQQSLDNHSQWRNNLLAVSSALNTTVSLGGINPVWGSHNLPLMEYAPRVVNKELTDGYYKIPDNKVFLPFHSMAAVNVGHLMWDDFLPIYSLLSMFDLTQDDLALVRYVLKLGEGERAMWGTCDLRDATLATCKGFFKKFLPLLGVEPKTMRSTEDSILNIKGPRKSKYVCSSKAVAGIGMLTDHGLKTHGWTDKDYEVSHNSGRAPVLYQFRNFMMRKIGLDPTPHVRTDPPHKITFAISSSKDRDRRLYFFKQIAALKAHFQSDATIEIENIRFSELSMKDQVRITSESSIVVGACGGGAVTDMFLPKGAGLILYYPDKPSGRIHNYPARLDWDYFNNVGYIRVHWLPTSTMDTPSDLDVFVKLIENELETVSHH